MSDLMIHVLLLKFYEFNFERHGDSLPIKLSSYAPGPNFRNKFLNNISEYSNCLNII